MNVVHKDSLSKELGKNYSMVIKFDYQNILDIYTVNFTARTFE